MLLLFYSEKYQSVAEENEYSDLAYSIIKMLSDKKIFQNSMYGKISLSERKNKSIFLFLFNFSFFKTFIHLFLRERACTSGGGAETERETERERDRIQSRLQALSCQHRALHGA